MTASGACDVLVVTCNPHEQWAVLTALGHATQMPSAAPDSLSPAFDLGQVGPNRVFHVHTRQGEDSAVSVAQAVRAYQPAAVIAVGICWGAWGPDSDSSADKQQHIGDVLIADKLKSTGAKRLKDGAIDYPDDQVKTTRRLADSLMLVLPFWSQQPGHRQDMGLMLSEPTLYNDAEARNTVLKAFPKAMGGEMEAQGIARWAAELKTDWIMFKGICDWGVPTKTTRTKKQTRSWPLRVPPAYWPCGCSMRRWVTQPGRAQAPRFRQALQATVAAATRSSRAE